jgi:hypothetical protein
MAAAGRHVEQARRVDMSGFDAELEARIAQTLAEQEAAEAAPPREATTLEQAAAAARELAQWFGSDRLKFAAVQPGEVDNLDDEGDGDPSCKVAIWCDEVVLPVGFVMADGSKRWFEPNVESDAFFVFSEIDAKERDEFLPLLREELLSSLAILLTTEFSDGEDLY